MMDVKRVGKTEVVHQKGPKLVARWRQIRKRVGPRFDSWLNALTGFGVSGYDPITATQFHRTAVLSDEELEALFNGDDLAARIVEAIPEDALREGYEITVEAEVEADVEADEKDKSRRRPRTLAPDDQTLLEAKQMGTDVEDFLEDELHATERLTEAWVWGRLFGFGAIYMIVNDGPETDQAEPLDLSKVKSVDSLMVLDKQDVYPASWYDEPDHPKFGEVETYRINTSGSSGAVSGQVFNLQIHETRLITFEGARTTNREKQMNEGFCLSVLQRVIDTLKQFNTSWSALSNMLRAASQGVFKMEGLIEMIAAGNSEVAQQRMGLVDLQRSAARSLLIDETETFEQVETHLTGVPDSLRVFLIRLAAAAKMPLTVLMGMSPAGLNATGESDLKIWANTVATEQNRELRPRHTRLIEVVMNSSEGPTRGVVPERWGIEYPSLLKQSEKEDAEVRKLTAEADKIWIEAGVLLPEEVAMSRFPRGGFSTNTVIDLTDREEMLEDPSGAGLDVDPPTPEPEPQPEPEPEPDVVPADPKLEVVDPDAVDPTTALNGAQVKALQELVMAVANGDLPKATVERLIVASFPISETDAKAILADVEEPDEKSGGGDPPAPPSPGGGGPPSLPPDNLNQPPPPPPTGEPEPEPEPDE